MEHEGPLGRVGGRSGGSGTHLRIVGEGATATEEREEGDQEGAGGGVGERDTQELMNKGERKKERASFRVLPPALLGAGQRKPPSGGWEEKETGNLKESTKCEAAPVKSRMADGMGSGRSRGAVGESGRGGDQGRREGGREWGDGEEGRVQERGGMPGISRA